jgi:hypothetical protein
MTFEPQTQWLPNVGYGASEIIYDDPNTTYDSATTRYNGAAYNIPPIGASQNTQWADLESSRPQKTSWSALEQTPQKTLWS